MQTNAKGLELSYSMKRGRQEMEQEEKNDFVQKSSSAIPSAPSSHELRFIEFYAGVGGWTSALQQTLGNLAMHADVKLTQKCCAALDHSDLCTSVYQHNHGAEATSVKQCRIENLTAQQLNEWSASVWLMSPPCQPHTRQHSNQVNDLQDARSASFLRLAHLLACDELHGDAIPSVILLENVAGFEQSRSFGQFCEALATRDYLMAHFLLDPSQVGFPNDRPRYYCVAVRASDDGQVLINCQSPLHCYFERLSLSSTSAVPPAIKAAIPELLVQPKDSQLESNHQRVADFLDQTPASSLKVPADLLERPAAWCFDIVTPDSRRSSCFTSGYGRFIRGTGSILYTSEENDDTQRQLLAHAVALQDPKGRQYNADWMKELNLDANRLRYFSGTEMARLLGFGDAFSFPAHVTAKQQWKLMGNSLNVCVTAKVIELGLKVLKFR